MVPQGVKPQLGLQRLDPQAGPRSSPRRPRSCLGVKPQTQLSGTPVEPQPNPNPPKPIRINLHGLKRLDLSGDAPSAEIGSEAETESTNFSTRTSTSSGSAGSSSLDIKTVPSSSTVNALVKRIRAELKNAPAEGKDPRETLSGDNRVVAGPSDEEERDESKHDSDVHESEREALLGVAAASSVAAGDAEGGKGKAKTPPPEPERIPLLDLVRKLNAQSAIQRTGSLTLVPALPATGAADDVDNDSREDNSRRIAILAEGNRAAMYAKREPPRRKGRMREFFPFLAARPGLFGCCPERAGAPQTGNTNGTLQHAIEVRPCAIEPHQKDVSGQPTLRLVWDVKAPRSNKASCCGGRARRSRKRKRSAIGGKTNNTSESENDVVGGDEDSSEEVMYNNEDYALPSERKSTRRCSSDGAMMLRTEDSAPTGNSDATDSSASRCCTCENTLTRPFTWLGALVGGAWRSYFCCRDKQKTAPAASRASTRRRAGRSSSKTRELPVVRVLMACDERPLPPQFWSWWGKTSPRKSRFREIGKIHHQRPQIMGNPNCATPCLTAEPTHYNEMIPSSAASCTGGSSTASSASAPRTVFTTKQRPRMRLRRRTTRGNKMTPSRRGKNGAISHHGATSEAKSATAESPYWLCTVLDIVAAVQSEHEVGDSAVEDGEEAAQHQRASSSTDHTSRRGRGHIHGASFLDVVLGEKQGADVVLGENNEEGEADVVQGEADVLLGAKENADDVGADVGPPSRRARQADVGRVGGGIEEQEVLEKDSGCLSENEKLHFGGTSESESPESTASSNRGPRKWSLLGTVRKGTKRGNDPGKIYLKDGGAHLKFGTETDEKNRYLLLSMALLLLMGGDE